MKKNKTPTCPHCHVIVEMTIFGALQCPVCGWDNVYNNYSNDGETTTKRMEGKAVEK